MRRKRQLCVEDDLTIRELTDEMKRIKNALEFLLLKHGFRKVSVEMLPELEYGKEKSYFNYKKLYCEIGFMKLPGHCLKTKKDCIKDCVFIEYYTSIDDARSNVSDYEMPLAIDQPIEWILETHEKDLLEYNKIINGV